MPSTRRQVLTLAGVAIAGAVAPTGEASDTDTTSDINWPMSRHDPAGTGTHPTASGPKDDIEVMWTYTSSTSSGQPLPPILLDGTLYATHGGLVALDSVTGTVQFERGGEYRSTPASAQASIYTTDTLAVTGGTGIVGLNAGGGISIPGVDLSVGVQRWTGPRAGDGGLFGQPTAVDAVAVDGTVYTAPPGADAIVALDANSGAVNWRQTPREDETGSVEFNRPAVYNGRVFVTNWPYQVTAYDAESGTQRWQRELDEQLVLAPVATDDGLVVQTRSSVSLLDRADGATLWNRALDANVTAGAPAVADGRIFLADNQGAMHALDLASGASLWSVPFSGETTPVVADGVVYAVEARNTLLAVGAESGQQQFTYEPEDYPISTPIVGEGALYLPTYGGVLALEGST